jgi:hypothetical protein
MGALSPQHVLLSATEWSVTHEPGANAQATATKPSAGSGASLICTGISASFAATGSAPTAINVQLRLRDGASGAGRVLWAMTFSLPAVAGAMSGVVRENFWRKGSPNTPMTFEFSATGGANTIQSVDFEGVTVKD